MVATQTAPSAEATRGRELGIDQQTQLTNYLAAQHKAGYIAPTRLGEGAYADASGNVQGLPAAALPGYINQKDQNGNWVTSAVNGGLDAVKASKAAQAIGNATTEIMPQTYGPRGEALPYQTKREAIEGVNAPPVTSGAGDPTRAQSGGASGLDIQAALREIANTKASMSSVTDQSSKQALQAHIDDITKQISNVGNYPASMSGIPSAPSAGAGRGSLVPQLGVQNNINLLQGQGSDLLKSAQAEQAGNLQTNQYFDEIAHLMGNGAKFGPMQADIAKWKAMVPGVDLTGAQTNQDVMRKLSANLAGNRGTRSDADLANWQKAYPNGEMTNDAISQVLPMLRQTLGVGNARAKVLTSQSTNGGLETLPKVANEFNQIASPSVIADGNALAQASASGKLNDFMARIKQKYPNDWSQRLQTIKKLDGMGAF